MTKRQSEFAEMVLAGRTRIKRLRDITEKSKDGRTFDRWIGIANLMILALGATLAFLDWPSKHYLEAVSAAEAKLHPTDGKGSLEVERIRNFSDGTALYDISFSIEATNRGHQADIFSYSKVQAFVGQDYLTPDEDKGMIANLPPDPWLPDYSIRRPIHWHQISCATAVDKVEDLSSYDQILKLHCRAPVRLHDGLTGQFPPGTPNSYDAHFFIRAKPGEYVGIAFTWGLNGSLHPDSSDVGIVREMQRITE